MRADTIMHWIAQAQTLIFMGLAFICALWMFRLWKRTRESTHLWLCGIFFCRLLWLLNHALLYVHPFIPGMKTSFIIPHVLDTLHVTANFLFRLAECFCIFAALASFAGKTVPFSKFARRMRGRFLKFIEPLRVKMP